MVFGHKYVLAVSPYNDKNPPTLYILIPIKQNQSHWICCSDSLSSVMSHCLGSAHS